MTESKYWIKNCKDQLDILQEYFPKELSVIILQYGTIHISCNTPGIIEYGAFTHSDKNSLRFWFVQRIHPSWLITRFCGDEGLSLSPSFIARACFEMQSKPLNVWVNAMKTWDLSSVYMNEFNGQGYQPSGKVVPSSDFLSMHISFDISWSMIFSQ